MQIHTCEMIMPKAANNKKNNEIQIRQDYNKNALKKYKDKTRLEYIRCLERNEVMIFVENEQDPNIWHETIHTVFI